MATDISETSLERARSGSYSQLEVNRGLPAPLLTKYFNKSGIRWQISPEIQAKVEFRQLNLLDPLTGIPPADIVFIRNVMIYFEPDLKKTILGRVRDLMDTSSHLFLGSAETTLSIDDHFKRLEGPDRTSCYQLKEV